jgi:hypothetical protein
MHLDWKIKRELNEKMHRLRDMLGRPGITEDECEMGRIAVLVCKACRAAPSLGLWHIVNWTAF